MIPREELESTNNPITITKQEHNTTTTTRASSWGARSKDPRIVRVSRALGGKDRHSKVCTVRGLRDRRVRLSVPTAIQLYDLQDRLGLNQPSKVVDWLLNAAKHDIDELPPLQFPQGGLVGPGFNFQPITGFQDFAPATQALIKDRASGETSSSNVGNDETGETRFVSLQHHQQGEVNDFLSRQNFSTNQNLATWEPPNLTLNHFHHQHPSIGLGLNAHHHQNDQDSQSFDLNNQVFFYHHHHQLPYFPHTNAEFDQKQPNFVPELSNSVRPFQFSMSTTANLLPFQNNAVNDENKRDELH